MLFSPGKTPVLLACLLLVGLITFLWPSSSFTYLFQPTIMDNLDSTFTIEINGKPVAAVGKDAAEGVQAQLGSDPAHFTLKDGRLVSGDWVLGRNLTEDRSMAPKKVTWFKDGSEAAKNVHTVIAHPDGETHQLKFGGGCLIAEEEAVFVDLFAGEESCSKIQFVNQQTKR